MREVLLIVRKDLRHLWPRVLALLLITALWGWLECELFAPDPVVVLVRGVWVLCSVFLAASVIHEERLPGHNQYWLTRPYSRTGLAGAKLLFLAAFEWLPVLAMAAVALAANGLSPWRHALRMMAETLLFTGAVGAIAAALASVTENLVQLLWGVIPAIAAVSLAWIGPSSRDPAGNWQWGSLEWIRISIVGGLVVMAATAAVVVQYWQRRTAVAQIVLGAAILAAAASPFLGSWHAAWSLQAKPFGGQVHLTFDPASKPVTGFGQTAWTARAEDTALNLPVRIDDLPAGTALVSERVAVRLEARGRTTWDSGWRRSGGLWNTAPLEDPYLVSARGVYQQYVTVDRSVYDAVKNQAVRLHAAVAVTLLGEWKSVTLANRASNQYRSEEGACRVQPGAFAKLEVSCAWFEHSPARSYVTAPENASGQVFSALISTGPAEPIPLDGSVWDRATTLFSNPRATREMRLETWQAIARFEREIDIPAIRLADYAVRRVTDVP